MRRWYSSIPMIPTATQHGHLCLGLHFRLHLCMRFHLCLRHSPFCTPALPVLRIQVAAQCCVVAVEHTRHDCSIDADLASQGLDAVGRDEGQMPLPALQG